MARARSAISIAVLLGALAGCLHAPSVVDVPFEAAPDPEAGPLVRIVRVTDRRAFEHTSPDRRQPTLREGDPAERALTVRAFARRGQAPDGRGAMGNLFLPEGRDVETLVSAALARGFRQAGYRVVEGPEDGDGIPVAVDVHRFWAWLDQSIHAPARFDFEVSVVVWGDVGPFASGGWARGEAMLVRGGRSNAVWAELVRRGLEDLSHDLRTHLQ